MSYPGGKSRLLEFLRCPACGGGFTRDRLGIVVGHRLVEYRLRCTPGCAYRAVGVAAFRGACDDYFNSRRAEPRPGLAVPE